MYYSMQALDIKDFITDNRDSSWEKTISKLRFIAAIKEGQKIDVKSMQFIDTSYSGRAWRTLFSRGECREGTLVFIKETFGDALSACSKYVDDNDETFRQLGATLGVEIKEALYGLTALKKTYFDDPGYLGRIDSLIMVTNIKLTEIQQLHPDIVMTKAQGRPAGKHQHNNGGTL